MPRSSRCVAIVFGLWLPTAPSAFAQPGTTVPELAAGRPGITESAGVAGNGVIEFEGGLELEASRPAVRGASVAIGHAIAGRWAGFGEIAAADGDEGAIDWLVDAGLSRPIRRDAQTDVELGHRLAGGAPDWTFGAGLVIRRVGPRGR
jgi:hypothetical protein